MVAISALWIPILLSAVIVFIASSVMHMLLPYHRNDYHQLPEEDKIRAAVRMAGLPPGLYMFPYSTPKEMKSTATLEKLKEGPVGILCIFPNGPIAMPKLLGLWFGYSLLISFFVAYLTGHTVSLGANYLSVFRIAGTATFMAYGFGSMSNAIWKGQPWSMAMKEVFDGLVYGLLTAGTFGWLWPR
jgi:hypothetical protein